MGTNYYVRRRLTDDEKENLKHLLDEDKIDEVRDSLPEEVHIGKSSMGWRFLFNHNNWEYYKTIEDLKEFISNNNFYNEYGSTVDPEEFWKDVYNRERNPEMLDAKTYEERWNEIHPGESKPFYMLQDENIETEHFGLIFSTDTQFC